tara:strand:- start:862 stop:1086 length:225 start_codon:yes stop_codon:yes gene_type:complete
MIKRYGIAPLAFALFAFTFLLISIIPSPHKACLDNNLTVLNNLDRNNYSDDQIVDLGKAIGEGCRADKNYQLTT